MTEADLPHLVKPVEAEWRVGNWVLRKTGLNVGFEYVGSGLLEFKDTKDLAKAINEISFACLLSTPDPMTEEGLAMLQGTIKERLDREFDEVA